jgi:hypothetical protein
MADTGFFKGWLGPFKLIRRYASRRPDSGHDVQGRVYEARTALTSNPALVVIPGEHRLLEPQEEWRVRLRSQAMPPYVALEVEKAPRSGRLSQLCGMFELLSICIERLDDLEQVRVHLTGLPVGPLELLKRRWRTLAACGGLLLSSGLFFWGVQREMASPLAQGAAVQAVVENPAPTLIDTADQAVAPIAYPLPEKPFSDQAKAPCKPNKGEVEIQGGCWVELAKRPPCYEDQAEYGGKCYLPVSARSREKKREPQSLQP